MKNLRKNNNAITLIALVITIIILLILAGVTISTLAENGLFEKTKLAKDIADKSSGQELLMTKIYSYQTYAIDKNEKITLEGLKEYLKDDEEIEYINLYLETASLIPVQIGEYATHAKVKLKRYKYEYILNQKLEIIEEDEGEKEPNIKNVEIDSELQKLLDEAHMTITLEDVLNTPGIMDSVTGLIPILTESDVTISEENNVIIYTNNNNGEIIRTNSEHSAVKYGTWNVFDNNIGTSAFSKEGEATGYYVEYEFNQEVYAMQIKYKFANASGWDGTRTIVIQGYDEKVSEWKDLTNEIVLTGNDNTFKQEIANLNYSKSYRKYRFYVKSATANNSYGALCSGLWEMQLYGGLASKISGNSNENLKRLLLSNSNLDKITLDQIITNTEFTKRLIDALSIETVSGNEKLMANLYGLVQKVTGNDVTRSEENGVVIYTNNNGEKISTNSEHSSYKAWQAFDNNNDTCTLSQEGAAKDYYIEYEFNQKVYVMRTKYQLTNGSSSYGNRTIVIQGYDEETSEWKDLTNDIVLTGNIAFEETLTNLNYSKPYKKYRFYVKDATANNYNGLAYSGLWKMQFYGKLSNLQD